MAWAPLICELRTAPMTSISSSIMVITRSERLLRILASTSGVSWGPFRARASVDDIHLSEDLLQRLVVELHHIVEGEELGPDLLGQFLVVALELTEDLLLHGAIRVVEDLRHRRRPPGEGGGPTRPRVAQLSFEQRGRLADGRRIHPGEPGDPFGDLHPEGGIELAEQARRVFGGQIGQEHRNHLGLLLSQNGQGLLWINPEKSRQWSARLLPFDLVHDLLGPGLTEPLLKELPGQFEPALTHQVGATDPIEELGDHLDDGFGGERRQPDHLRRQADGLVVRHLLEDRGGFLGAELGQEHRHLLSIAQAQ